MTQPGLQPKHVLVLTRRPLQKNYHIYGVITQTVDHEILLNKLKAIGLDDLSTSWFSSYLKNRFQKTEVDGIFSDPMVVPC